MYINKLDHIVNKCNNAYQRKMIMKPIDAKISTYADFEVENNVNDSKFKVSDHIRIWKVKKTISWTFVFSDLNSKEITGTFNEKDLQKTNETEFRVEKVIRKNYFNILITD